MKLVTFPFSHCPTDKLISLWVFLTILILFIFHFRSYLPDLSSSYIYLFQNIFHSLNFLMLFMPVCTDVTDETGSGLHMPEKVRQMFRDSNF